MNTDDYFRTTDLTLAAYLSFMQYQLHKVEVDDRGRATFIFEAYDRQCIDDSAGLFLNRNASVEPTAFMERIRALKASIGGGKR